MSAVLGVLLIKLCILNALIGVDASLTIFDKTVKFTVFTNESDEGVLSTFDEPPNCDPNGLFAFVVHGWLESIETEWVMVLVRNLTYHRGGCVIFMDYSRYSKNGNYFGLVGQFWELSKTLVKKIIQTTTNFDNVFMFGFSFGARLVFEAGSKVGYQLIDQIHVCDPAGPGFNNARAVDPKFAAKHVYCVNTSNDLGTGNYNCHINFRMGNCGANQIGSTGRFPCRSHGMCPYVYNSAFTHEFLPDNIHNCTSNRLATNIPNDFRMGYLERRKSFFYYGDVFIPTAKYAPWNVVREQSSENTIE